ncbi:hypothetical protein PC116_g26090 [Phytophthora cactorum]|nr:hypothetical protein PC116_g26090 [Phytophthora cactorum]
MSLHKALETPSTTFFGAPMLRESISYRSNASGKKECNDMHYFA